MSALDNHIQKLIAGLTPEKARLVLQSLAGFETQRPERLDALRRVFEKIAYQARTQHARRLFTTLFEPFLVPDARAAALGWEAPGLLHRLDVGALWSLVAAEHGEAVQAAQQRLGEWIAAYGHGGLDDAPEVAAMADDLRAKAVTSLDRALADRTRLGTVLETINAWRSREAQRKQITPPLPPVGPSDLVFWRSLLAFRDLAAPLVLEARKGRAQGLRLVAYETDLGALANVVGHAGGDQRVGAIVPLHRLNEGSDFQAAADYLAMEIRAEAKHLVLAAIERHFRLACETLAESLTRVTGKPGSGPLMPRQEAAVTAAFDAFDGALAALADLDLLASPVIGGPCCSHVADLLARIERDIHPALLARTAVAATAPHAPSDQAMLVHMVAGLERWVSRLPDHLYWGGAQEEFQKEILRVLQGGLAKALAPETHASPLARFAHIARVEAIGRAVGVSLVQREMPPTPVFVRAALERLADPAPLTGTEEDVIQVLMKAAEAELARIKYWKDPLLSEFVAAVRNRPAPGAAGATRA